MEIKGTAIVSTLHFIEENFPNKYKLWYDELPLKSRKFFDEGILAGNWYPLIDAYIVPTEIIGKVFYSGNSKKAAYELGKYSGFEALKGIYKIFVRMASMQYVLKKLKSVYMTYYSDGELEIIDEGNVKYFKLKGFEKGHEIIITRIAGWAEALFTIISKEPSNIEHTIKDVGDNFIEGIVKITWD